MAKHMGFAELGLTPDIGIRHLCAVDNRTPPPAETANNILNIDEPPRVALNHTNDFKMEFNI